MSILDRNCELAKRPEAAFLLPNEFNPTDLYHYSEYFFESRREFLEEGCGVIFQKRQSESCSTDDDFTETLIFDATSREKHVYTWQFIQSTQEERIIWRLRATNDGTHGIIQKLDHQLRLIVERQIDSHNELVQLGDSLIEITESAELLEAEDMLRQTKLNARRELLRFIRSKHIRLDLESTEGATNSYKMQELFNKAYDDHYRKLSTILRRVGFTALHPFNPTNSTIDI